MSEMYENAKAEVIVDRGKTLLKIVFKGNPKPKMVTAHRFNQLIELDDYTTEFTLLLDFYRLLPFSENQFTQCGTLLEDVVAKHFYPDSIAFEREPYGTSQFNNKGVGGYLDRYQKSDKAIIEIKTVYTEAKYNVIQEGWKRQTAVYWKLWNSENPNEKIDKVKFGCLYVPFKKIQEILDIEPKSNVTMEKLIEMGCKPFQSEYSFTDEEIEKYFNDARQGYKKLMSGIKRVDDGNLIIFWNKALSKLDIEALREADRNGLIKLTTN